MNFRLLLTGGIGLALSCGAYPDVNIRLFSPVDPIWKDTDQRPFAPKPKEYFSGLAWDGIDKTVFYPMSRFFAVDPRGESTNVNAMDEVPDSSWFTNRIGLHPMTPAEAARGSCTEPPLRAEGSWIVKSAKPNGANPGFVIKANGRRYLLKFDGKVEQENGERATAADVIGSRIYHAAGYFAPCNTIVFFDPSILTIDPDAKITNARGKKLPMTWKHVEEVLSKAYINRKGQYRASASLYLSGEPLGPWTYEGTRSDDPNDVIPHENRRELRGNFPLAAWLHHFDAREQNTLSMWIKTAGDQGYVRHNYLDFGDCFGSLWDWEEFTRRIGHAYYFDVGQFFKDIFGLGLQERTWEKNHYGKAGRTLGYYNVEDFNPDLYKTGYPNPAFRLAMERDKSWMARILSRFSDTHLAVIVDEAKIETQIVKTELLRILKGRKDKILRRYFEQVSPLTQPVIRMSRKNEAWMCLKDAALEGGVYTPHAVKYSARAWGGLPFRVEKLTGIQRNHHQEICVQLPDLEGTVPQPKYLVVDVFSKPETPARVHLYQIGKESFRIVGLERPTKE